MGSPGHPVDSPLDGAVGPVDLDQDYLAGSEALPVLGWPRVLVAVVAPVASSPELQEASCWVRVLRVTPTMMCRFWLFITRISNRKVLSLGTCLLNRSWCQLLLPWIFVIMFLSMLKFYMYGVWVITSLLYLSYSSY